MTPYAIAKRELKGYFCTPIAYVFLIAFLVMAAAATFLVGDFFTFNEASLRTFFFWLPWLYLLLVPAAGMRLWSEERRQGTSELLLTLPVTPAQAVTGKFLAGWLFLTFGLLLTFPLPITVAILGDPDVGAMATGYIGAFLLAGAFLAICSLTSACTKNQVVSFVVSAVLCLILVLAGHAPTALLLTKWGLDPQITAKAAKFSAILHQENFQRGIIAANDLAYYALLILATLRINQAIIECQRGYNQKSEQKTAWKIATNPIVQAIAAVVAIASAAFLIAKTNLAIDCTDDKIFTLSRSTKNVLKDIDRTLTIDFYRTIDLPGLPPAFKTHARRLDDLLAEYERQANGKIRVRRHLPVVDSPEEEQAIESGVMPQNPFPNKPELRVYLGLAFSQTARRSLAIPFLSPERATFLEYDLTKTIAKMTPAKRANVGIISPLKILGGVDIVNQKATQPWALVEQLKENNVNLIPLPEDCDKIPDSIDVLLIAHPQDTPDQTAKAVDEHIQNGGNVAMFLDPACWTMMQTKHANLKYAPCDSSDLRKLTDAWNVQFSTDKTIVDINLATILINRKGATTRHLDWLTLDSRNFVDQKLTAALTAMELFKAGNFTGTPPPTLKKSTVIASSNQVQSILSSLTFRSPQDILTDFKPEKEPLDIAIKLEGVFTSPFGQQRNPPKSSTAILVGDADLLHDAMSVKRGNHNLQFLLNIVDTLAGGDTFADIRNRANITRPLLKIQKMEDDAQRDYQARLEDFENEYRTAKDKLLELDRQRRLEEQKLLTVEQRQQFLELKKQVSDANRQLRQLRANIRQSIESYQFKLILANLAIIPTLLALTGIAVAWKRSR
jgi:ABC-2 type transport system permease protein